MDISGTSWTYNPSAVIRVTSSESAPLGGSSGGKKFIKLSYFKHIYYVVKA